MVVIVLFYFTGFEMEFDMKSHVSKNVGEIMEDKSATEDRQCHQCFKVLSSKRAMTRHMKHVHENSRRYACETCDRRFNSKILLVKHVALLHKKQKKTFQCGTCNKTFTQEGGLK